jgi:hypothetical protein
LTAAKNELRVSVQSSSAVRRNADTTLEFLHDLRQRVIGQPEISTDGFLPYRNSIRDTFGDTASHGVIPTA